MRFEELTTFHFCRVGYSVGLVTRVTDGIYTMPEPGWQWSVPPAWVRVALRSLGKQNPTSGTPG